MVRDVLDVPNGEPLFWSDSRQRFGTSGVPRRNRDVGTRLLDGERLAARIVAVSPAEGSIRSSGRSNPPPERAPSSFSSVGPRPA